MKQIVLLRGVNVGGRNKLAMPALRETLAGAGMREVVTYVQSGNVVLDSDAAPDELARECQRLIADGFGLDVDVLARTRAELAKVVGRNPFGDGAAKRQPKLCQVSFCSAAPAKEAVAKAAERAVEGERVVLHGREIYAWLPHGVGRSKLAAQLGGRDLGVVATARNWTTVTKLLALADA